MRNKFATHEKLPIHVIGNTDLERWPIHLKDTWNIFQETIAELQDEYDLRTHTFVLMKNHYHWLCTYDHKTDPGLFDWFHEILNLRFLEYASDCENCFYVMNTHPKIIEIRNFPAYKSTYKYVYSNPVTAGIVARAEDYVASTLPYVLGLPGLEFQCVDNMNLIVDAPRTLDWINSSADEAEMFDLGSYYQFLMNSASKGNQHASH